MSKKNSNFIPERLTRLRIMSNLTQIKLAKEVNVSRSCLANYETGKRTPGEDMVKIFADFFNVETDYFFV